jgi:predicted Zn-dependent peptidase
VGGASNAGTGWEWTDYWYVVPAEHFSLALDVLADQMLNSSFPADEFDRERQVVFEELKLRDDSPNTRASDEFINLVFQVSPLRRHPAGTIESVQSIPIETILEHRDRHYYSGNMVVAVSGRVQHDEAVAAIEQAFADLPQGVQSERPATPEPVQTEPRLVEVGAGSQVAEIRLGWPAPGDDHPDSPAVFLLDDMLGDTGQRLTAEIRDRRALATSVGTSYYVFSDAGALMLSASTVPGLEQEVVDLMLEEVRRIRDGDVTEDDLRMSLRAAAGRRALQGETNLGQSDRALTEVSGVLDSFDEYLARLRPVTPDDVQRVAQTYFDPNNYTLVIVRS